MRTIDLTGKRIGRWTVLGIGEKKGGRLAWRCRCDCGREKVVTANVLGDGRSRSCGCLRRDLGRELGASSRKHGHAIGQFLTPEYQAWSHMKHRCLRKTSPQWKNYGARGIVVCERWLASFENFLADMGPRPSPRHSLGRIDNDLGYSPSNCRWETDAQQNNNHRRNRKVEIDGEVLTVHDACLRFGISREAFYHRLRQGMSEEDSLRTPSLKGRIKGGVLHPPR